ncbi:hypothetical protein KAFR_0L02050 [Kazachstania africana CBS 2517]|uniref:F-box domain-containing protein n=1 Tax=Kazachstania africana (strain ATCC 22294 / BCRC 22015 / CBS 2517 / CECT 1963 / NBRC 1671 / NRRL Y-8276) TaxID=1071382 RepID=H2B2G6_KAZAF|nr:hypothetical protein KAFR_0L02050 [Kazachstania africana CBS 2517]CCF60816.1 hypothetical protein KAFR_0L02050 [Kazachstania africana CBS 2517]
MREINLGQDEPELQDSTVSSLRLELLPAEILINIFSNLNEQDLNTLKTVSNHFNSLITDEELWKNLLISKINSTNFPSFANSKKYSIEYMERYKGLNQWKHNRAVKTKYVISPTRPYVPQQSRIEKLIFEYPRCACYNDGVITLVHLQSRRSKQRLTYIPCTTPQGCSTMHFNINAAVFGRFDGRVFGKLLSNKSYLTPVMEFNSRHSSCVTAITTSNLNDSNNYDWCVSGSENGEVFWWCETKLIKSTKVSDTPILKIFFNKDYTIVVNHEDCFVFHSMELVNTIKLPQELINERMHFAEIDFGIKNVILASLNNLFMISFNSNDNSFGYIKKLNVSNTYGSSISKISIDESTALREQDMSLAGGDGCYMAVLLSNNQLLIINTRLHFGSSLKVQKLLDFESDHIFTFELTNLVLVVALSSCLRIIDPTDGELIKIVQKTDKYPEFLEISQGKMIIGSGNSLHYLTYINDNDDGKRKTRTGTGGKTRSNKWNETLNSQLEIYDEQEESLAQQRRQNERLLQIYGGHTTNDEDVDEELQLRIALLESQDNQDSTATSTQNIGTEDDDEEFRRILEESQRQAEIDQRRTPVSHEDDDDEELRRALEQSRLEQQEPEQRATTGPETNGIGNTVSNNNNSQMSMDEELQLAIALSLSELQ